MDDESFIRFALFAVSLWSEHFPLVDLPWATFGDESALSSDYDASNTRPENDFRATHTFPRIHAALGIDQLRYSSCWHGSGVGHQPSLAQRFERE
jgi:hypothetical protein